MILWRVVHEDTRNCERKARGGANHGGDAGWSLALPVRADHHIETWFCPVLLSDLSELVRTPVVEGVDPETITEVRYLEDGRFLVQIKEAGTIDHVLVRTGDEALLWR